MTLAAALRGPVTAVAVAVAALPPTVELPPTEPLAPLAVYSAQPANSRQIRRIDAGLTRWRTLEYPVTNKTLLDGKATLSGDDLAELGWWIDALDRL